jgi:hypothetical protein
VGETTGGGFETLGGDKTHCFITRTQAYNYLTQKLPSLLTKEQEELSLKPINRHQECSIKRERVQ